MSATAEELKTDEEVVAEAKAAQAEAESAEAKAGSPARWQTADCFYTLAQRGWSTRRIGSECGVSHTTARIYISAVERYLSRSRPTFWHAYSEVTGERRAGPGVFTSETAEWSTPQDIFDELNSEFGFTLDVCATDENAKCSSYFTETENGLAQPWTGICWMNPPYGDVIPKWIAKAHESAADGATVVCLVPARIDTGWWWDHCRFGEVRFLRGRLKFGGGENSAPFPSAVVIFGRLYPPLTAYWER